MQTPASIARYQLHVKEPPSTMTTWLDRTRKWKMQINLTSLRSPKNPKFLKSPKLQKLPKNKTNGRPPPRSPPLTLTQRWKGTTFRSQLMHPMLPMPVLPALPKETRARRRHQHQHQHQHL